MGVLEADAARAELVEHRGGGLGQALCRWPDVELQARTLLSELLGEPAIADQDGSVARQEQVAALAAEPGQVGDVDGVADQQQVQAFAGKRVREAVTAGEGSIH